MNKFFRNFLLCGDADYHCLICRENFTILADVEKHIRWETHRKSMKNQTCVAKFKKDLIYKIENVYYCQICSITMPPSVEEITSHIHGEGHIHNKNNPISDSAIESTLYKYDNTDFINVSNFIISNEQWHCIRNEKCLLCCEDIVNVKEHVKTVSHILKIIKSKVVHKSDNDYYRKIDEEIFFCFGCKKIVTFEEFENHWAESHSISKPIAMEGAKDVGDKNIECIKKLLEGQQKYYFVDKDTVTATCKQCKVTVPLDFKTMVIHQKNHAAMKKIRGSSPVLPKKKEKEYKDHGKQRAELAKFGRENFIKLHSGGGRGYCTLCHGSLSGSMVVFKEHVEGVRHRNHLELKGLVKEQIHVDPYYKSLALVDYLQHLYYSESMKVIWINQTICVNSASFVLTSCNNIDPQCNKTKCFACDTLYAVTEHEKHYKTEKHKEVFLSSKVLLVSGEFIREIRPNIFHCGFCNQIYPFWEQMEKHLLGLDHSFTKKQGNVVEQAIQRWHTGELPLQTSKVPEILFEQVFNLGIFETF